MNNHNFERQFYSRNPAGVYDCLSKLTVAIAGAGGLGSNVATLLLRAGVKKFIIADFDRIEYSNLNRQFFFHHQIGQEKAVALKENLRLIHPEVEVKALVTRVTSDNISTLFNAADIMIEAFDRAELKAMLVHNWLKLYPERYIITATGLAGFGNSEQMQVTKLGKIIICGDQHSTSTEEGLVAPRVMLAAALQANAMIELAMQNRLTRHC